MSSNFNPSRHVAPRVLATDLDGTLVPQPDRPDQRRALAQIRACRRTGSFDLIFATGRHVESVMDAAEAYDLPTPDWIVCDVGTSIYRQDDSGFNRFEAYADHLASETDGVGRDKVEALLAGIDGLAMQQPDHQGRFKISYQSASETVGALVDEVNRRLDRAGLPYACTGSVDPLQHCGLLDVLPRGASKAYALTWLADYAGYSPDEVVFAGDSGNDKAALVSGFRAIVVANASPGLADEVAAALGERGLDARLYVARAEATAGVLEGCRHFGLIAPGPEGECD